MFSCLFGTKLNIYFSIILFYFNSFCGISFIMLMSTKLMGGGRMVFKDFKFSDLCSGSPGVHTEYIPQICG